MSFMLVTTIATMTFTIAIAVLTFITLRPYTSPPLSGDTKLAGASLQQTALYIDIVPYLGQNGVDQHYLTDRLLSLTQQPANANPKKSGASSSTTKIFTATLGFVPANKSIPAHSRSVAAPNAGFPDQPEALIALDRDGHMLAAASAGGDSPTGILAISGIQEVIQATLAGAQTAQQTTFTLPDGTIVAGHPAP